MNILWSDWFLDILGITEREFMDIALKHVAPQHVFDPDKIKAGKNYGIRIYGIEPNEKR